MKCSTFRSGWLTSDSLSVAAQGQVSADFSNVLVAALDTLLGPAQFKHPARKASTGCIDIQPSLMWSQSMCTGDPQSMADARLKYANHCHVLAECVAVKKPGGTFVFAPSDELAVSVTVLSLKFQQDNNAVVRLHGIRGGPAHRIVDCRAQRADINTAWVIHECMTVAKS